MCGDCTVTSKNMQQRQWHDRTTHLSIFLHECPEVQDVCTTLTSGLHTCLGILPCYRVETIERTSWKRWEESLMIFVSLEHKMVCVMVQEKINATFQNALFFPGRLMNRWRGDEDHSVCRDSSWSQKPGDLLQVLWILLHRDMLLGDFICKTGTDERKLIHIEIWNDPVFKYTFWIIPRNPSS